MKTLHVIAAVCACAGVTPIFAGTIDFENAPATYLENGGGQDLGGYYSGVTFGPDAQITTTSTVYPAHSGQLELTDANIANPDLNFTFATVQPDVSFWYTDEFGFVAKAYDKNDNFLGFKDGVANVNLSESIGTDNFLDFGFGGIAFVDISDDGGLGNFLTIDDLSAQGINGNPANPATAPDAGSTLALLGVSGVGLLAFRRKVAIS